MAGAQATAVVPLPNTASAEDLFAQRRRGADALAAAAAALFKRDLLVFEATTVHAQLCELYYVSHVGAATAMLPQPGDFADADDDDDTAFWGAITALATPVQRHLAAASPAGANRVALLLQPRAGMEADAPSAIVKVVGDGAAGATAELFVFSPHKDGPSVITVPAAHGGAPLCIVGDGGSSSTEQLVGSVVLIKYGEYTDGEHAAQGGLLHRLLAHLVPAVRGQTTVLAAIQRAVYIVDAFATATQVPQPAPPPPPPQLCMWSGGAATHEAGVWSVARREHAAKFRAAFTPATLPNESLARLVDLGRGSGQTVTAARTAQQSRLANAVQAERGAQRAALIELRHALQWCATTTWTDTRVSVHSDFAAGVLAAAAAQLRGGLDDLFAMGPRPSAAATHFRALEMALGLGRRARRAGATGAAAGPTGTADGAAGTADGATAGGAAPAFDSLPLGNEPRTAAAGLARVITDDALWQNAFELAFLFASGRRPPRRAPRADAAGSCYWAMASLASLARAAALAAAEHWFRIAAAGAGNAGGGGNARDTLEVVLEHCASAWGTPAACQKEPLALMHQLGLQPPSLLFDTNDTVEEMSRTAQQECRRDNYLAAERGGSAGSADLLRSVAAALDRHGGGTISIIAWRQKARLLARFDAGTEASAAATKALAPAGITAMAALMDRGKENMRVPRVVVHNGTCVTYNCGGEVVRVQGAGQLGAS